MPIVITCIWTAPSSVPADAGLHLYPADCKFSGGDRCECGVPLQVLGRCRCLRKGQSKQTHTPGAGTNVHLGMEWIARHGGISMLHVPHSGAMSIIRAVLGGQVMLMVSGTEWKPQVEAGRLRLLMIWTATRIRASPTCRRCARAASR